MKFKLLVYLVLEGVECRLAWAVINEFAAGITIVITHFRALPAVCTYT